MAEQALKEETLKEISESVAHLIKFPSTRMWIDYDKEADVLYISFNRPQKATDSEMLKDGILVRYKDGDIVGVTILDASTRGR